MCEYQKLLKSTDYELKKNKVKEYYDKGEYVKATELLAQVLPRYRATEEAEGLSWMNAEAYLGMKDYIMAGSEFKNFSDLYSILQKCRRGKFYDCYVRLLSISQG